MSNPSPPILPTLLSFSELWSYFRIHKDLLASACDFFRQQVQEIEPHFPVGQCTFPLYDLEFEEYEPIAFELFVDWLYRKSLPALDGSSETRATEQVRHYITLYLMAESWAIASLKNLIIDTIKARQTCHYGWFPVDLIKRIYAATTKGSCLRRYIVDSFLCKTPRSVWSGAERAKALMDHADAGNVAFLLECYEGLFGMAYKSKMRNRDPGRRDKCFYHEHERGMSCGDG